MKEKIYTYYFTGGSLYKPLYFEAVEEASTVALNKSADNESLSATLKYSYDNTSWEDYTWTGTSGLVINLLPGEKVYFKGNNETFSNSTTNYNFAMTGKIEAGGNIMSLLDESMLSKELTQPYCFKALFRYCSALLTPPELPATTLSEGCYHTMFSDCSNLPEAPELPADELAPSCYRALFQNCSNLVRIPETLPATLSEGCYYNMFRSCTSLTSTPVLPATTLIAECYYSMFYGCTSLTKAPALPATTLANSCYRAMFFKCSNLTDAPTLPAKEVPPSGYYAMFEQCVSLKTPPALPATILGNYCYGEMFRGSGIVSAPELPATTLNIECYRSLFYECTSLSSAPAELPATILPDACYAYMFQGCTSLTNAPIIRATTLASNSCFNMFRSCSLINEIDVNFTAWTPNTATQNWVQGVATSGTFKCPAALPETRGISNIPVNWTIENPAPETFNLTVKYFDLDEQQFFLVDDNYEVSIGNVINAINMPGYVCKNTPHTVDANDAATKTFVFEYELA